MHSLEHTHTKIILTKHQQSTWDILWTSLWFIGGPVITFKNGRSIISAFVSKGINSFSYKHHLQPSDWPRDRNLYDPLLAPGSCLSISGREKRTGEQEGAKGEKKAGIQYNKSGGKTYLFPPNMKVKLIPKIEHSPISHETV